MRIRSEDSHRHRRVACKACVWETCDVCPSTFKTGAKLPILTDGIKTASNAIDAYYDEEDDEDVNFNTQELLELNEY